MKKKQNTAKLTSMERVSIAHLIWTRYLQRGLLPYGINLKQVFMLRQLSKKEFLFPSQIAQMLFCDRPTATVIIRNMERQGWVKREKDPENKKRTRIFITPEGKAKLSSIPLSKYRSGKTPDPLSCFNEEEKEQFEKLMIKLTDHLKQMSSGSSQK
jgi:DNA-binding MarR family transcriptional regulator